MASKNGKKRAERGLNVKIEQGSEKTKSGDLHVNSYKKKNNKKTADKNKTVRKETAKNAAKTDSVVKAEDTAKTKNTAKTKDTAKAENVAKTGDTAKTEPKKTNNIKAATKKPASFSKTPAEQKSAKAKKPEKPAKVEKVEKIEKTEKAVEVENVERVEKSTKEQKPADKTEEDKFETLKINDSIKKETASKIILRDVAQDNLGKEVKKVAEKTEKTEKIEKAEKAKTEPANEPRRIIYQVPTPQSRLTAQEIKDREIKKAISTAAKLPSSDKRTRKRLPEFGWQRIVLALCCAATAVFAIAYFVNLNSSNISLKVAAMQSGIDATYPSYVPRGYNLSDITSSSGKVTINFKGEDGSFSLTEESSSWDSNALLNNYIKDTYGEDYTMVREQGLTLYMGGDWEAWVNGGVVYKLKVTSGSLTKKQMKTIATSL